MFSINPTNGLHAAAGLTNEQLRQLAEIVHWELALRLDKDDYRSVLEQFERARREADSDIERVREERDLVAFAHQVMTDLARLPTTEEPPTAEAHSDDEPSAGRQREHASSSPADDLPGMYL